MGRPGQPRQLYTCANPPCQQAFLRYPSTIRNPPWVYCSITCRGAGESLRQRGEDNKNYRHGAYVDPLNRTPRLREDEIFSYCDKDRRKVVRSAFYRKNPDAYICAICGQLPWWQGAPLTLHLDHVDGNPYNNTIDNLRWACPNCHEQTPTYKSRNPYYRGKTPQ